MVVELVGGMVVVVIGRVVWVVVVGMVLWLVVERLDGMVECLEC